MLPYLLLLLISFCFCFCAVQPDKKGIRLHVGDHEYVKSHNLALPVFFLVLFVLVACRGLTVGNDTVNYAHLFHVARKASLRTILHLEEEVLYYLLNWTVGRLTADHQWLFATVAALTILPMATLYSEDRRHSILKILLFVNMSTYVMLFSGIRQSLAIAVGILAYRCTRKKQPLLFIVLVLVAMGIHHSAFVLFLMYPLYRVGMKRIHLLLFVPALGGIYLFNNPIFSFLTRVFDNYSDKYITESEETGAYAMLVLFILFAVMAFIFPDEERLDDEFKGLRSLLLLTVMLQCFAPVHNLAMRMNYYFIILIPVLIPRILDAASDRWREIARYITVGFSFFFALYYISTLTSAMDSGGLLHTVPYVPFWR